MEKIFPEISKFGNPFSFYDFIKEQYRKPNPLIRVILLLRLGDLEFVYDEKKEEK